MVAGIFSVGTTITGPLSIKQFYVTPPVTPGNVGVCLSGGGSRALTAGMGQLRALNKLAANGHSLLAQVKALSTVSGGSWLGVPFTYLPPGSPSDTAYLGPWVEDQSTLTPAILAQLPAGNAGVPISSPLFAPKLLAVQALLLYAFLRVPADMLWQTLIGLNILADYGLYAPTVHLTPTDTFSFDAATVATQVANPSLNPTLAGEPIDRYADSRDSTRTHRPFLTCNSAMFLKQPDMALELLAPVQITSFITGIFGTPTGEDGNGRKPGGGGVNTFGFNAAYLSASGDSATVAQTRQWSLTDAVGTSSAFFAEVLQNLFAGWRRNPADLAAVVASNAGRIQHWIRTKLPIEAQRPAADLLRLNVQPGLGQPLLQAALSDLQEVIPSYQHWSVLDPQPSVQPRPSQFADGGNLENTGIAALLAYSDIDSIIAFINPATVIAPGPYGIADGHGGFIPGTMIIVDSCIPPLFGYQPYGSGRPGENEGYVPYGQGSFDKYPIFANNQVFASAAFPALLQGLWAATGGGSYARPAIFTQRLAVRPNTWFGVTSPREVTVVWYYLSFVAEWEALFANNQPVRAVIELERSANSFPNYSTLDTNLSATQINLLANLTAWSVNEVEKASGVFSSLFKTAG
ncbi:MAG TPA: hypothetical protein VFL96_09835 [Acidobacteriaceae bacterium]|jgi:hypothetical protein|nr:hypothetical protein [Acidobacteriaceae bacterium]